MSDVRASCGEGGCRATPRSARTECWDEAMSWSGLLRRAFRLVLDPNTSYTYVWSEDPPELPQPGYVYLIGERAHPWSAAFTCPCGCKELISISLVEDDDPRWRVSIDRLGAVSL